MESGNKYAMKNIKTFYIIFVINFKFIDSINYNEKKRTIDSFFKKKNSQSSISSPLNLVEVFANNVESFNS